MAASPDFRRPSTPSVPDLTETARRYLRITDHARDAVASNGPPACGPSPMRDARTGSICADAYPLHNKPFPQHLTRRLSP